jgi:hypothetical protein
VIYLRLAGIQVNHTPTCNSTEHVLHHQELHDTVEFDTTDNYAEQVLKSVQKSKGVKHKHQNIDDMIQLSSAIEVKRKKIDEAKGEHISCTLDMKRNKIDESYCVERRICEDITADIDDNQNCLSEIRDFLDLYHFDPDEYNMEDSIVFMYKMALLYTSYGNYCTGKAPPLVRSDEENTNLIAYFQAVVQSKGTQKLLNRWLTREEAIEVIYFVTFGVFE